MPGAARNIRGNSSKRRLRRRWLIEKHGIPNKAGEKTRVRCHHCGKFLRAMATTWHVDRHPVCGHMGGRYTRDNVVVSCGPCNERKCGNQHRDCVTGPKMQMKWRVQAC